jgi:hypothetical protein
VASHAKSAKTKSNKQDKVVLDLDGDGSVDLSDLILLLRNIDDPMGEIAPGSTLAADVNGDGLVNLQDAISVITSLADLLGPEVMGSITPDFFTNSSNFPWDQPTIEQDIGERQLSTKIDNSHKDELHIQETCGAQETLSLAKGAGPKPFIGWGTTNCSKNTTLWSTMSLYEKTKAYASWIMYRVRLVGAYVLLPDAARAYANYRENKGEEIDISNSYLNAIEDDSAIKVAIDDELAAVASAVVKLFNGQEGSFDFHSTTTRLVPKPSTENWQKAVGGHRIWSSGTVTYNAEPCKLEIDMEIFIEVCIVFHI